MNKHAKRKNRIVLLFIYFFRIFIETDGAVENGSGVKFKVRVQRVGYQVGKAGRQALLC